MSGTLTLVRAGPEDAAAVRALTRAAYALWVPVIGREPAPMTADYDMAVRRHRIDLLRADGDLVGLIELEPEPGHLMIVNVAIASGQRGRGYGRHLLAHAEAVARELGLPMLRLYTHQLMAANIRMYLALGYRIDGETVTDGFARVNMSKPVGEG